MVRHIVGAVVVTAVVLTGCSSQPTSQEPSAAPSTPSTASPAPVDRSSPKGPQGKPFDVTAASMTIHSFEGKPETGSGGFRMNCFPLWRQVEPRRGEFNWPAFDSALQNTKSWGGQQIIYSFCGTPEWAAGKVKDPAAEVFGKDSTAPPSRISYFEDYVRAVVRRYKGQIDAYEIWNEATSPQFWQGTPDEMAEMTERAARIIHAEDPEALVTSASIQTHRSDYYKGFFPPYLKSLKKRGWPVDVWNGHFYPAGRGGPAARRDQIAMMRKTLAKAKAPARPLWDTEVNYFTGEPGTNPAGRVTGERAQAWAVRTYLDGWRLNVPRNYWYFWTLKYDQFPGIQTRPGLPATKALATFSSWVVGSRFNGCDQKGAVVRCFFAKDGSDFTIAWAEGKKDSANVTANFPLKRAAEVCRLTDGSCSQTKKLELDQLPVKIQSEA